MSSLEGYLVKPNIQSLTKSAVQEMKIDLPFSIERISLNLNLNRSDRAQQKRTKDRHSIRNTTLKTTDRAKITQQN